MQAAGGVEVGKTGAGIIGMKKNLAQEKSMIGEIYRSGCMFVRVGCHKANRNVLAQKGRQVDFAILGKARLGGAVLVIGTDPEAR